MTHSFPTRSSSELNVVHIELIPASAGKDFAMASGGGGRCIQPREIGDQPWIAPRCVAHPDPDYAVALDDGPAAHPGGAKNGAMWICHTCTGVIEAEPMITADENAAIIDLAGAERREAMRTAILDQIGRAHV